MPYVRLTRDECRDLTVGFVFSLFPWLFAKRTPDDFGRIVEKWPSELSEFEALNVLSAADDLYHRFKGRAVPRSWDDWCFEIADAGWPEPNDLNDLCRYHGWLVKRRLQEFRDKGQYEQSRTGVFLAGQTSAGMSVYSLGTQFTFPSSSLAGAVDDDPPSAEQASPSDMDDDAADERVLSERVRLALIVLRDGGAINSDKRMTADDIARKAANSTANSFKRVIARLAADGLIETQEGRGGGAWLTPAGSYRAANL